MKINATQKTFGIKNTKNFNSIVKRRSLTTLNQKKKYSQQFFKYIHERQAEHEQYRQAIAESLITRFKVIVENKMKK